MQAIGTALLSGNKRKIFQENTNRCAPEGQDRRILRVQLEECPKALQKVSTTPITLTATNKADSLIQIPVHTVAREDRLLHKAQVAMPSGLRVGLLDNPQEVSHQ